jgi:hypothetical protein
LRIELEFVEAYKYEGIPGVRYRFRIKGTKIYINVTATNIEEASKKAEQIIRNLELDKYLQNVSK